MSPPPRHRPQRFPTWRAAAAILAFLGLASVANAAEAIDRLGIPGPLNFSGTAYRLAWSSHPTATYYKQEYLPTGQASSRYRTMLVIEVIESGTDVATALAAQVRSLNQRKGKDPLLNLAIIQNRQTGEALLDFIISAKDSRGVAIAEWNAYRYAPRKSADGRNGVMLVAVSHRAYGDADIREFLGKLKSFRPDEINRLAQHPLPTARLSR